LIAGAPPTAFVLYKYPKPRTLCIASVQTTTVSPLLLEATSSPSPLFFAALFFAALFFAALFFAALFFAALFFAALLLHQIE
jgi:hypothetical protein